MPPTADNVSVSVPNVAQSVKMDSMVRAKLLWLCGMERKCDAIEQGYCVSSQYQFEAEDSYLENVFDMDLTSTSSLITLSADMVLVQKKSGEKTRVTTDTQLFVCSGIFSLALWR